MKKLIFISFFSLCLTAIIACSKDEAIEPETEQPTTPEEPETPEDPEEPGSGNDDDNTPDPPSTGSKTLVAYFSATGTTHAVAQRIVELTGADVYRIEAANPYAENPYNDSYRIQDEAYNDRRPEVANLPEAETIARYDTLFVGSPTWWHQPAMVVCTFLEAHDLKDKVVIPFFTYGATTYLNESMQKIYKVTPNSIHIPATLPEDLDPDNIREPQSDDAGIDMPGNTNGTEAWLRRIGVIQ